MAIAQPTTPPFHQYDVLSKSQVAAFDIIRCDRLAGTVCKIGERVHAGNLAGCSLR